MLTGLWDLKRYSKLPQKAVLKITWSMSAWKLLATSYGIVIVWFLYSTLPGPALEIRGEGWSYRPLEKGRGPVSKKVFFRPFGPQSGLKIRCPPPPRGRSPGPATVV